MMELRSKHTAGAKFNIAQDKLKKKIARLELDHRSNRQISESRSRGGIRFRSMLTCWRCVCVCGRVGCWERAVGRPCSVRFQFNPPVQEAGDDHPADLKSGSGESKRIRGSAQEQIAGTQGEWSRGQR